ncbi:MAG: hypothetical protein FWH14_03415 [Oscillospiraceae bacterium]|nr:hypothetical protein [Oscillospiraceae bacterium]
MLKTKRKRFAKRAAAWLVTLAMLAGNFTYFAGLTALASGDEGEPDVGNDVTIEIISDWLNGYTRNATVILNSADDRPLRLSNRALLDWQNPTNIINADPTVNNAGSTSGGVIGSLIQNHLDPEHIYWELGYDLNVENRSEQDPPKDTNINHAPRLRLGLRNDGNKQFVFDTNGSPQDTNMKPGYNKITVGLGPLLTGYRTYPYTTKNANDFEFNVNGQNVNTMASLNMNVNESNVYDFTNLNHLHFQALGADNAAYDGFNLQYTIDTLRIVHYNQSGKAALRELVKTAETMIDPDYADETALSALEDAKEILDTELPYQHDVNTVYNVLNNIIENLNTTVITVDDFVGGRDLKTVMDFTPEGNVGLRNADNAQIMWYSTNSDWLPRMGGTGGAGDITKYPDRSKLFYEIEFDFGVTNPVAVSPEKDTSVTYPDFSASDYDSYIDNGNNNFTYIYDRDTLAADLAQRDKAYGRFRNYAEGTTPPVNYALNRDDREFLTNEEFQAVSSNMSVIRFYMAANSLAPDSDGRDIAFDLNRNGNMPLVIGKNTISMPLETAINKNPWSGNMFDPRLPMTVNGQTSSNHWNNYWNNGGPGGGADRRYDWNNMDRFRIELFANRGTIDTRLNNRDGVNARTAHPYGQHFDTANREHFARGRIIEFNPTRLGIYYYDVNGKIPLRELIDEAENYDRGNAIDSVWDNFQDVLSEIIPEAKTVLAVINPSQDDVDAVIAKLQNAMNDVDLANNDETLEVISDWIGARYTENSNGKLITPYGSPPNPEGHLNQADFLNWGESNSNQSSFTTRNAFIGDLTDSRLDISKIYWEVGLDLDIKLPDGTTSITQEDYDGKSINGGDENGRLRFLFGLRSNNNGDQQFVLQTANPGANPQIMQLGRNTMSIPLINSLNGSHPNNNGAVPEALLNGVSGKIGIEGNATGAAIQWNNVNAARVAIQKNHGTQFANHKITVTVDQFRIIHYNATGKAALRAEVAIAETVVQGNSSNADWAKFRLALIEAREILGTPRPLQSDVDRVLAALEKGKLDSESEIEQTKQLEWGRIGGDGTAGGNDNYTTIADDGLSFEQVVPEKGGSLWMGIDNGNNGGTTFDATGFKYVYVDIVKKNRNAGTLNGNQNNFDNSEDPDSGFNGLHLQRNGNDFEISPGITDPKTLQTYEVSADSKKPTAGLVRFEVPDGQKDNLQLRFNLDGSTGNAGDGQLIKMGGLWLSNDPEFSPKTEDYRAKLRRDNTDTNFVSGTAAFAGATEHSFAINNGSEHWTFDSNAPDTRGFMNISYYKYMYVEFNQTSSFASLGFRPFRRDLDTKYRPNNSNLSNSMLESQEEPSILRIDLSKYRFFYAGGIDGIDTTLIKPMFNAGSTSDPYRMQVKDVWLSNNETLAPTLEIAEQPQKVFTRGDEFTTGGTMEFGTRNVNQLTPRLEYPRYRDGIYRLVRTPGGNGVTATESGHLNWIGNGNNDWHSYRDGMCFTFDSQDDANNFAAALTTKFSSQNYTFSFRPVIHYRVPRDDRPANEVNFYTISPGDFFNIYNWHDSDRRRGIDVDRFETEYGYRPGGDAAWDIYQNQNSLVKFAEGATTTIPIIPEMATGYDPNKLGEQIITISYGGQEVTYTINVVEAPVVGEFEDLIEEIHDSLATAQTESAREAWEEADALLENPDNAKYFDADDRATLDGLLAIIETIEEAIKAIEALVGIKSDMTVDNVKIAKDTTVYSALIEAAEAAKEAIDDLTYTGLWAIIDDGALEAAEILVAALKAREIYTVTFLDAGGGEFLIVEALDTDNKILTEPASKPTLIGKKFIDWVWYDEEGEEVAFIFESFTITKNITLTPSFGVEPVEPEDQPTVTINIGKIDVGGNESGEGFGSTGDKLTYTGSAWTLVGITAYDENPSAANEVFSHWEILLDKDNRENENSWEIFSYADNFNFTLLSDVEFRAIYALEEEIEDPKPIIFLVEGEVAVVGERYTASPIMTVYIPAGYTIIERGYIGSYYQNGHSIYGRDQVVMEALLKEDVLTNFAIIKIEGANLVRFEDRTRQYTTSFSGILGTWEYQVIAYVIVQKGEEEPLVIFSDLVRYGAIT